MSAERFVELGRELDNAILPHQKALKALAYLQKQSDLVISSRDNKEEISVPMDDIRKILEKNKREHEEEIKRLGEEAFETLLKSRNHI